MDMTPEPSPGRSLVVFCATPAIPKKKGRGWRDALTALIHGWLHPGFKHCFVLQPKDDGSWLVLDPMTDGLNLAHWPPMTEAMVMAELAKRTATAVWANRVRDGVVWGVGPITCVTAVKAHLGGRMAAITPYGLYLELTKEN